ncbi:MAG TPA: hypothetical protein VI199_09105 [Novosphingobium sp.]
MAHEHLALPYVLGTLSAIEREALSRARLYDLSLDRAIVRLERHFSEQVAEGTPSRAPSALWRRIASALAEERTLLEPARVETFPDGTWTALECGIESKPLGAPDFWLLRCNPGKAIRGQWMRELARMLVVAGDVSIGSRQFVVGDYLERTAADSLGQIHTVSGCIILLF